MQKPIAEFDAESVTKAWDHAAPAYAQAQADGSDYYRYEFLGPAQVAACGNVAGLRVLDVGCGSGYFAREMASRGARVTGLDISPQMIAAALQLENATPLGIEFLVSDAARIDALFPPESFDLMTSCLALQDMPEVPRVLEAVQKVLRPNGRLVMSIVHPFSDTPFRFWERDEAGNKKCLSLDRYFDRGPFECSWPRWAYTFTTPAFHATLEDWCAWILGAGFHIKALLEPVPGREALASHPDLEDAARMPYFLIFDLLRAKC